MPTKQFKKEVLQELIWEEELDGLTVMEDDIIDNSRWSIIHSFTFKEDVTGKFYRTSYSVGATEQQDEHPFEYEGDLIVCEEVVQKEVTIITYVKAK